MKIASSFLLATVIAVASASSHASLISAQFSGTVQSQEGTAVTVGSAISGSFIWDTATSAYQSFSIGGQSVAAGFSSSMNFSADMYSAFYTAQLSPVTVAGASNSTFTLDLEGLNPWTGAVLDLLSDGTQLPSNLSLGASAGFPSNFGYYEANSDGTDVHSVSALLSSIQVTTVAEPTPLALALAGLAVMALSKPRRR